MRLIVTTLSLLALSASLYAQVPRLSMSLPEAEEKAFVHSPMFKQAQANLESAEEQAEAQLSQLYPRVTLDGAYQYQTEVPKFSLTPAAPAFQFGTHDSYSIGPTLSFVLWDKSALLNSWRSQKALALSRKDQLDLVKRQVKLLTRLSYFEVQLACEQERSLLVSLRLSEAQYRDIENRYGAGSAGKIDYLSSHQQVLNRRRDFRSAQAGLAESLRSLFTLTGEDQNLDLTSPLDQRVEEPLPPEISTPTLLVALEPLELVETRLEKSLSANMDESYPQLLVFSHQAEAFEYLSKSIQGGEWPRIEFSFRSDFLYPNLPLTESAWQNVPKISATMPLFEYSRSKRQSQSQKALAAESERRRDEAYDSLKRDWLKARDRLTALADQKSLDKESTDETSEIARLRYASYRNGGSTILDVETANLNALDARIASARTLTQMLIQIATLDSMSVPK